MKQANILVVDDDKEIAFAIQTLLAKEGYNVMAAHDGIIALEMLEKQPVDLLILDVMMPNLNGLGVTMKIRETKNIPIIMLSAKTEQSDKIIGLSLGADDYVTKPFDSAELIARVQSHLRRYLLLNVATTDERIIEIGGLQLNQDTREFFVDGEVVKLTATEFNILEFLMKQPNMVFSAETIYEHVWKETAYASENAVMVHIRRIREKIEINPKEPKYLKVVWGVGYKIEKNIIK